MHLKKVRIDPQCLTIELTESLAMNDVAATYPNNVAATEFGREIEY